jgi:phosphate transport system substrate-binding protein
MRINRRLVLKTVGITGVAISALAVGAAWRRGMFDTIPSVPQPKPTASSLLIGGAGAMADLNEALGKAFAKTHAGVQVITEKGGSLQGLIAARRGAIDLAAMTRELSVDEDSPGAHSYLIARGNISIVVHPQSPLRSLTQQQVHDIFTGKLNNWKQLGGKDAPIQAISRAYGSSTRQFVERVVLKGADFATSVHEVASTKLMAERVANDLDAIGYIASKDSADIANVRVLNIDEVAASAASILSGRYPYTDSFYLLHYGKQAGLPFEFVQFARSPAGQAIVSHQGLISVC